MSPSQRPPIAQVVLGLFICGQLLYLAAANLVSFLPATSAGGVEAVRDATTGWARLTGQWQIWSLFAPQVSTQSWFPAVQLRWTDGRTPEVLLGSRFEPADPLHYWHGPGTDRLANFEANLRLVDEPWDAATLAGEPAAIRQRRRDRLRQLEQPVRAYLRWRVQQYRQVHPDAPPPDEVVLLARTYATPPPGEQPWHWHGPHVRPLVRWQPAAEAETGVAALEAFDPHSGRFVPVKDLHE